MTQDADRELLELAAKAAGLDLFVEFGVYGDFEGFRNGQSGDAWNPLADDGDEARLESALCLHVTWHPLQRTVTVGGALTAVEIPWGIDKQAARRLAGVRAAAAIGKEMP